MNIKPSTYRASAPAIALAVAIALSSTSRAATQITWTGTTNGSTTADWQQAGNWNSTLPVNSANTALFTNSGTYNSATAATVDADGSFTLGELQFATTTAGSTTPTISLNNSQNGIITLTGATGLLVQTKQSNPVTLNTNLALGYTGAGLTTQFNITELTTVNGVISGSGNFLKIGDAAVAFTGANTYTGTTTIQQNTLKVGSNAPSGSAGALGNSTSVVQVGNSSTGSTDAAALEIDAAGVTIGRAISVYNSASTGVFSLGGDSNDTGGGIFSGQITLNRGTVFASSTTGTSVIEFSGQISDGSTPGAVSLTGTGAVQLDNATNSYSGGTTVTGGKLILGGSSTVSGGIITGGPIGLGALTLATGTTLKDNGSALTIANAVNLAGTVTFASTGSGSLTIDGTGLTTPTGVTLTGAATATVTNTTTIASAIGDGESGYSLTKSGTGKLYLSGSNSYSGGTTVTAGTLVLSGNNTNTGVVALDGGTLSLASSGALGGASSIVFTGGTLQFTASNTNDYSNLFSQNAGQIFNIATNGHNVTFAGGLVSNGGALVKSDGGTLTLTGSSNYTGTTSVQNGTVVLGTSTGNNTGSLNPQTGIVLGNTGNSGVFQLGDSLNPVNLDVASLALKANATSTANAVIGGNAGISTLTVNPTIADTYAGALGGSGANQNNLALTVSGSSNLTLSGTNTYIGNTTITSGTLALATSSTNNIAGSPNIVVGDSAAHGSAIFDVSGVTNASGFHVVSGQTLSGFGSVNAGANTVTIDSGATIAPGSSSSAGTLTINGNAALAPGSTYVWKIDPTTVGQSNPVQDQLLVTGGGTLTLPTSSGTYILVVDRIGSAPTTVLPVGTSFILAEASSVEVNGSPVSAGTLSSQFAVNDSTGESWSVSVEPDASNAGLSDLDLTVTNTNVNTPEPGSLGLGSMAALGLLSRRRRPSSLLNGGSGPLSRYAGRGLG